MRRQMSSFALMVCGLIALIGGFTMLPVPVSVSAQSAQPSPRPTLQPTPDLRPNGRKPTAVVPGRLTGTIIDLRTHAPVAGVAVVVGDQTVYSDLNGNYDIWLTSGYYRVELELRGDQGTENTPAQSVAVGPGDTVVVHLFFTSPAPVEPAMPPAIEPTPTAAPAVALPPDLPDTSVARTTDAPALPADALGAPQSLPHTAAPGGLGVAGTWILFGALLLGLGLVVQLAPRPRRRAASLPRRRRPVTPSQPRDDSDILADLLDRDLP